MIADEVSWRFRIRLVVAASTLSIAKSVGQISKSPDQQIANSLHRQIPQLPRRHFRLTIAA
jgi:hypothetical protein